MARTLQVTEEEDWNLFKEDGDDNARGRLAEKYLPLVKYVIDRIAYRLPDFIDREDLISEGILGLIDALDKFDPSRMNKFETYAVVRIRGAVLDSLRQMDWVPRSLRQKSREIENAYADVERTLGRPAQHVPDKGTADAEAHDHELLNAEVIHQSERVSHHQLHGIRRTVGRHGRFATTPRI